MKLWWLWLYMYIHTHFILLTVDIPIHDIRYTLMT